MKCQICKENNANIIFTKIVNNEKITLNICNECAKIKGLTLKISSPGKHQTEQSSEAKLPEFAKEEEVYPADIACEGCGLTYSDFKKSGFFGCDKCYKAFGKHFVDLLKQIHGSTVHKGKSPLNISSDAELKNRLNSLRKRLQHCIESEEFERAAELRDKIANLEEKKFEK
jgi:protein arginine kinase activator